MKKLLLSLSLLLAAGAPLAQAGDSQTLRIGVEGAYPPYSWLTPEGELAGFDIDIAQALCNEMQVTCKLVPQDWDGMIPALVSRKFDAIVASMSITDERKQKVDFTDKYYQIPSRFVARKNTNLTFTPEGLKGKKVGVQRATTHDKYVTANFPGAEILRYGAQDEAFLDLKSGRIDLVINNIPAIDSGLLKKEGGDAFAFVGPLISDREWFGEGVGIAIRKNSPQLRSDLNQAIQAIRAKGVYQKIQSKYFDFDIYGG
ncbi:ABC transporter substrate-binding protein [Aestuariirhabdus litorea]|uniref:ABC transporter substrate-binding protein n=1 Tax=Aestuariirhabdus litorea TaxID=2528527 RepID=A0A3P3VPX8_9GAMM|nr:ABC transporter substrate-binding protein [Aestuariirhabdus litorea]RRJ83988.1 ABC transporter substrate-binding protein [Aestuariirhabdus litorea]RWW97208.1 transporter substrate-binding domain-containing protein [Endozoicomonadaceae bacterium GTF-13]